MRSVASYACTLAFVTGCASNDTARGDPPAPPGDGPAPAASGQRAFEQADRACAARVASECRRAGLMLLDGDGVAANAPEAMRRLEAACSMNDFDACADVGAELIAGKRATRDLPRAHALNERACAAGRPVACFHLGLSLAAGWTAPVDAAGALDAFGKACDGAVPEACRKAGDLAERGAPTPDPALAFDHYVSGWQLGDQECALEAQRLRVLGLATWSADVDLWDEKLFEATCSYGSQAGCVQLGWALVATNPARARSLGQVACDAAVPQGCTLVAHLVIGGGGGLDAQSATEAGPLLERGCTGGDALACTILGIMLSRCETLAGAVACDAARTRTLLRKGCDGKIASGCHELAGVLARGTQAERKEARSLAETACGAKDLDGCLVVGRLRRDGVGGARDPAGAAGAFESACAGKVAEACLELGRLREGEGVAGADATKVSQAYLDGCNLQHGPSCIELARLCRTGVARLGAGGEAQLFKSTCALGDQPSCVVLGLAELQGAGVTKDEASGVARLAGACQAGDQDGCASLGLARLSGLGGAADPAAARVVLEPACTAGKAVACAALGAIHVRGLGVKADMKKGRALLAQACKLGHSQSCAQVKALDDADRKATSDALVGILMDYGSALGELPACEQGDVAACRRCHLFACGTPEGLARLEAACARGVSGACFGAGKQWEWGWEARAKDPAKAIPLYDKACTAGVARACLNLGLLLSDDSPRAVVALRRGCELRDGLACDVLASRLTLTLGGRGGVRPDAAEADRVRHKACDELAEYNACFHLGQSFLFDYNISFDLRSRQEARKYFERACQLGKAVSSTLGCQDAEALR